VGDPGDLNTGLYQRLLALRERRLSTPVQRRPSRPGVEELLASPAQTSLWFADQAVGGSPAHSMTVARRVMGSVDERALAAALSDLAARHDALRTTFHLRAGVLTQVVHPIGAVSLERSSLGQLPATAREDRAREVCEAHAATPTDPGRGPLLAAHLVELSGDEHVLALRAHHASADGASLSILFEDLAALYEQRAGRAASLPEPSAGMADYTEWLRGWTHSRECSQQLAFWRQRLAGRSASMPLPTDRASPKQMSFGGGQVSRETPSELSAALNEVARRTDCTVQMVLIAALLMLLARYTRQTAVHVSIPVAGRFRPNLERTVGLIANRVPIGADVDDDATFLNILSGIRGGFLDGLDHHDVPFESVIDDLRPERTAAAAPFGQVLLQHVRQRPSSRRGPAWLPFMFEPRYAITPLHFGVVEGDSVTVFLRYSADVYERATAMRMAADYVDVLAACMDDPTLPVRAFGMECPAALHAPLTLAQARSPDGTSVAPRTPTEESLLAIWRTLLNRADLGVTDDFFDSGGHSLSALRLLASVEQTFGVRLPLPRMFDLGTVEAMASAIDEERE
jgi:acyl carrier protein